jgi:chromosome segregation ATPase
MMNGQPDFNLEEYFEGNLDNFSNNLIQIKEIFKQAMNVDVNYEFRMSIDNTLINMKDLMDQITQYFLVFKDRFSKKLQEKKEKALIENKEVENEEEFMKGLDDKLNADDYNQKLDQIHEELDELNQINIDRLGEIRDLNNKLEVLDEHLNSLMKDISEKRKKLLETNAKTTEVNSLIRSYENNLQEKSKLLKEKEKEYRALRDKSEEFNLKIGEMFFEIIELDKKTEALRQPVKEGKLRQENVENEMKERQTNLDSLEKQKEDMEREQKHLEKLSEGLQNKIHESEGQMREQEKGLSSQRMKVNKHRDELRRVIREQVRKVGLISGWKVNSGRWMCP